ncbi:hypothetical protein [Rubripirellula reticaptiva]|uniref:Uncharacterized protein n=1 Tax=Rubripirellula reticaptiva TaxID=2528013 RepID=A0A5C6EG55_9BACT|nr:hypothetical protein [Rubripirellula reticaptiva]TWU47808.1 hypothetical protein Poly59_46500 [Rubripirellula reticaptiva]
MTDLIDLLVQRTWWRYPPSGNNLFNELYHWFNIAEGTVWFVLSWLVIRRYWMHRNSRLEIAYSILFLAFGVTDFLESYALTSWLIWLKIFNVLQLFVVRRIVIRRYYCGSTLY